MHLSAANSGQELVKYLPDGKIDRSFGSGGRSKVEMPGFDLSVSDLGVDSKGRVVLFGTATDSGTSASFSTGSYPAGALFLSFATVIRYTAQGRLDPTFGGGDGIVMTDFGLPPLPGATASAVGASAGIVDNEDRPVFIAKKGEIASPCAGHSYFDYLDRLTARLTPAGELDVSFGGGGVTFLAGIDNVSDIALGANGAVSIVGTQEESCPDGREFALLRLGRNGVLNRSFGQEGMRRYRRGLPGAMALHRGSAYVQAEGIMRLSANGDVDRTFGRRGVATVHLPDGLTGARVLTAQTEAGLVAVDPAGRPLLIGMLTFRPKDRGPTGERLRRRLLVGRLDMSGRPDRSFGRRGWTVTNFGRFSSVRASDALIDRRGRLVVAGVLNRPDLDPTGGFSLSRYLLAP